MSRHVVFGTGQIGRLVAEQLVSLGARRRPPSTAAAAAPSPARSSSPATPPTRRSPRGSAAGADVVYFCLNATHYARWAEEFPPLQRGVLAGAEAAGARLVVLDNLYAYGPTGGRDLVETLPANPTSAKAATRAAMTAELLAAHQAGRVEVAIGRASDYFGPGATRSALGETVFGTALTGRTAQVMGNPDLPHSYSYTPDVAAALITLGTRPGRRRTGVAPAGRRDPHHPRRSSTRSTPLAGHRPRILAAGRTTLRLFGLVKPAMREYLHTLYQFTDRWVVDDTAVPHRLRRPRDAARRRPGRHDRVRPGYPPCSRSREPNPPLAAGAKGPML